MTVCFDEEPDALRRKPACLLEVLARLAPAAMPAIHAAWCEADLFPGPMSPPVCLLRFDVDRFDAGMFAAVGMELPEQIARSVHRRQAEFFFGRLAARAALATQGLNGGTIPIGEQRQPIWPAGVIGSISHINGLAAAAVATAGALSGLGLDIEFVHAVGRDREAMLMTVFSEEEHAYLQSLQSLEALEAHDRIDALLTMVFSGKESLFKGAYAAVGRYFDFSSARMVGLDHHRSVIFLVLQQTMCESFIAGQTLCIGYRNLPGDVMLTGFAW